MTLDDDAEGLRATLEDAFKAAEPAPETPSPEPTAPTVAAEAPAAPARDDKGRFASKDATAEPAAEIPANPTADATTAPVVAAEGATPPEAPASEGAKAPPYNWPAEAKAEWAKLPPQVQAAVLKREQDVQKFTSKRDEDASFGRDVNKVVQPYLPIIRAQGATPAEAIGSLLNTAYVLHTGTPQAKAQALQMVARQYGVPLDAFSGEQAQQPGYSDPTIAALHQEVAELKSRLLQQEQTETVALQQTVANDISAFAADPAHSHFEAVKGRMAALIASGEAKDLQDAYDQAVWSVPDVRTSMLAQQEAEREAKRKADEARRLEEARRKAVSVVGAPGIATANAVPTGDVSLRDQLQSAMRSARGVV